MNPARTAAPARLRRPTIGLMCCLGLAGPAAWASASGTPAATEPLAAVAHGTSVTAPRLQGAPGQVLAALTIRAGEGASAARGRALLARLHPAGRLHAHEAPLHDLAEADAWFERVCPSQLERRCTARERSDVAAAHLQAHLQAHLDTRLHAQPPQP